MPVNLLRKFNEKPIIEQPIAVILAMQRLYISEKALTLAWMKDKKTRIMLTGNERQELDKRVIALDRAIKHYQTEIDRRNGVKRR